VLDHMPCLEHAGNRCRHAVEREAEPKCKLRWRFPALGINQRGKEMMRGCPPLEFLRAPAAAMIGGIEVVSGRVASGQEAEYQWRAHDYADVAPRAKVEQAVL